MFQITSSDHFVRHFSMFQITFSDHFFRQFSMFQTTFFRPFSMFQTTFSDYLSDHLSISPPVEEKGYYIILPVHKVVVENPTYDS